MHFPIERFGSLDYDARAKATLAWQMARRFRQAANNFRKLDMPNNSKAMHNSAILAIRDVKYWAEKAKEKNRV